MQSATLDVTPIPALNILEESIHSSFRQHNRDTSQRTAPKPPKLPKTRYETFLSPQFVSYRGASKSDTNKLQLSKIYDSDGHPSKSYFHDRFQVIAKIGEGSFSEVFKVRSNEDGYLYAIKRSMKNVRGEMYRQERLLEVRRHEQLSDNEHCIKMYRAWEEDSCLYMQLELCKSNLEDYLLEQKFIPESRIWSIILDMLLAVKALHDRDLIHLDIKLDNILIDNDNSCRLCDFGLVFDLTDDPESATEGDSRYIAPEVLQGVFSKAADIFSLGVAMLELASDLELPSSGESWLHLRTGVFPEDYLTETSSDLKTVIRMMMNPNPDVRPTVDELLDYPLVKCIYQRRQRWALFKVIKNLQCQMARNLWRQIYRTQNSFVRYSLVKYVISLLPQRPQLEEVSFATPDKLTSPVFARRLASSTPITATSTPRSGRKRTMQALCDDRNLSRRKLFLDFEDSPMSKSTG